MLHLVDISKSFGERVLFSHVNIDIGERDRVALIGPNGSGKSTLFNIITGESLSDTGQVIKQKYMTIGYLRQDINLASEERLIDNVIGVASTLMDLQCRVNSLQTELELEKNVENHDDLIRKLGDAQHQFELAGGYDIEYRAKTILSGLGFKTEEFERPQNNFSGGWLMRAELAKLLLLKPKLLLLDEPTNHLDLEATIWFEKYLAGYRGSVMITSHDRAFLNRVVNKVLAIENGNIFTHTGNYDSYVWAHEKMMEATEAAAKRQEKFIEKETRLIERFRYKKTKASMVQSRIKRLEKLQRIVSQVAQSAAQIATASNQLHSTAEQIATGAEEVAAQAATVATAGEEMSATSGDIAQNCQMAAEGAQRAAQTGSFWASIIWLPPGEKVSRHMSQ